MNRFNKNTERCLLITDTHIYKLDQKKQFKVLKKVPLDDVSTDSHTHTHSYTQMHTHSYTQMQTHSYTRTHTYGPL